MPYTVLLICFFISGATALIYEVIWVRLLALTFGNTVYAVGIVLTSFMSGLSVGSLVIGRWADRGRNLLRGYGFLEWGIAVSALLSPPFLERITGIYLSLSITSLPLWTVSVIRYLLSIAVLLIPTTLMGGTLPVLSRFFIRSEADLEKRLGELYSLNTIGGVLGTFLVGFIMMRFIGISMTLKITALVNAGIGGIAYYLGTRQAPAGRMEVDVADAGPEKAPGYAFALSAFFVSGFTAMVYEVAWSRLLVGVIGSTTYAFSIILIGFLSGIGIGSLIVSRISSARRLGLVHFSGIEVLIGLSCFLTLVVFSILPHMMLRGLQMTGHSYSSVLAVDTLIVLFYLLVPTCLFGATFPVIAGIYSGGQRHRGSNIGNIYAANTFGAIFGSSLAAFYLLPHFGASASVKLASLVNVLVGLTGIALLRKFRLLAACAVLLAVPLMPVSITEEAMVSGVAVYGKRADFTLESDMQTFLYLGEGLNATIAVTTNDDGSITLSTNGKADGSTGGDMSTQLALAYFPLFLHRDPADVLIIGYGTGVTARAAADYADVERIDAIEIEPDVLAAGDLFNPVSRGALHDPKLKLHIDDARSYIVASQKRYDVIISEPSNPWISGIGNLFSREFFEMSRARLKQGGLFCQWVQLYGLNPDVLKMIIRTFSAVFPETAIWQSNPADILLVGSMDHVDEFDYQQFSNRLLKANPADLAAYLHIYDPMDFFSYFVAGRKNVEALSSDARFNTDDMPLLEFEAPFSLYASTEMQNNELLQKHMSIPEIRGYPGPEDVTKEYLFRKCLNFMKLDIPVDRAWRQALSPAASTYLSRRQNSLDENNPARNASLLQALDYRPATLAPAYQDIDLVSSAVDIALKDRNRERALHYLEKAEAMPQHIISHSDLYYRGGMGLQATGDMAGAERYLRRSVATNAYHARAVIALAELYREERRMPLACEAYRSAERLLNGAKRAEVREKMRSSCAP